jgi:hypothetical protein
VGAGRRRELEYISLRTASALAYISLVGRSPDARDPVAMHRILNDVAHAISIVAPIHMHDGSGATPETLDGQLLAAGRFERGAAVLVSPDGKERSGLLIQRRDLESAIAILAGTGLAKALRAAHGAPEDL